MSGGIVRYRATSGEGTFPGQGGASKYRRKIAQKRNPLGAHDRPTRGLIGTLRSMSILWARGRFLGRGRLEKSMVNGPEEGPGQWGASKNRASMAHKRDPLGDHEKEPRGAKKHSQINVYVMGNGMCFLGNGSPRIIEGQWPTRTSRDSQGG